MTAQFSFSVVIPVGDRLFPIGPAGRTFWESCSQGELALPKCLGCSRLRWYLQPTCPRCEASGYEWVSLSGDVILYSFTVVHRRFGDFPTDELPYIVAFVNPVEDRDTRLVARIVDTPQSDLELDMHLQLVFRDIGGLDAPMFRAPR